MYMHVNSVPPATSSPLPIPGSGVASKSSSATASTALTNTAPASGMGFYADYGARRQLMEFYPPPYGFAAELGKSNCSGMGDCGCGGKCGGCGDKGMGQLFESTDISTWGPGEWAVLGVSGLAVISLMNSITSGVKTVRKTIRRKR